MKTLVKFLKDESGATAIEYGLIAAFVALALVAGLTAIGANLSATFGLVSAAFP